MDIDLEPEAILAACGLYCGACYHYRACFYDDESLVAEAARRGRPVVGFTCQGCRSERLYVHPGCADCLIRACADRRGIPHCGLCPELPCERLAAFQSDSRLHHRDILDQLKDLRQQGADRWLALQAHRWQCACGEPFHWYQETCHRCGAAVPSYGPDATLK